MKMINKTALLLIMAVSWTLFSCHEPQKTENKVLFDFDWKFALGDFPDASNPDFDDSGWRTLDVPHDFSIEHPFDSLNATEGGGGYVYSDVGWYRKHFVLEDKSDEEKVSILFNGIYRNSEVWINGHYLGMRPYGYSSFYYDLTEHLNPSGQKNILAVKVNTTEQPNSRWYTGAGIYRHVWLITTGKVHFEQWGVFAQTEAVNEEKVTIKIALELINENDSDEAIEVYTQLTNSEGKSVAETNSKLDIQAGAKVNLEHSLQVENPELWSIDNPYLYQLSFEIKSGDKICDFYTTAYGIRTFQFDPDRGFFLNGEAIKLKGVNNHHDGGPLGAACMDYTFERQLKILKEMGCNALRMSHNPPAPELLDAADRLGFVVIDEIFDEWTFEKRPAGYSPHFWEWYERDVANWIRRDRNHPSVISWSIGNEVPEQWDEKKGPELAKLLIEAALQYDTTRHFTAGLNGIPGINKSEFGKMIDFVGYNYHEALYKEDHTTFPNRIIYGSETVMYPYQPGDCFQMHTYEEWVAGQMEDYVAGEFIWTGFDYLGEASIGEGGTGCNPWDEWIGWPSRGASCGMVDICGFKKPGYWFRKALWSDDPVIYIAVETDPSAKNREEVSFWGWPKVQLHWNHNNEGDTLAVHVYTNIKDVDLLLNGKSLGSKQWEMKNEAFLVWNVPFEEGSLKAVGTLPNGEMKAFEVKTAGEAAKIKLVADKKKLVANKQDLSYIQAYILDNNDIPVPFADHVIEFEVNGVGTLNSVGNGDQMSHISFKGNTMEAYLGRCLAIIQSGDEKGDITITARSEGLPTVQVTLIAE